MPPAQAAIVVLAATRPMPEKSIADRVDPGLNPYQPNHRITPPMAPHVRSCGGVGPPPSFLNFLPSRGPRAMAPARAMKPPTVWTTVDPAKSRNTAPCVNVERGRRDRKSARLDSSHRTTGYAVLCVLTHPFCQ